MLKKTILMSIVLLLSAYAIAAQVESPKLTPVAPTENQQRLTREGVALHDQGKYDAAAAKYEEVLKENPDNVETLYEITLTYFTKKDYRKSLEFAYRGARYKSNLLGEFYVVIGSSLDDLGDSKKAIEVYKAGIKLAPNAALLHYNLGITYGRIGKPEEARKSLKKSLSLNPNHASSHLALGDLFYKGDYKTPALLAMSRFLMLEPDSPRSATAYRVFKEILQGGVSQDENTKHINVVVTMSDKKDEGDFGPVDMAIGLTKAGDYLEENKGKTQSQLAVAQLNTYFAILSEQNSKGNQSKFVWKYYVPYFSEMKKRNYIEPFYYYVSRSSDNAEVKKWLEENFRRVSEFLNWSKQYQWAKAED